MEILKNDEPRLGGGRLIRIGDMKTRISYRKRISSFFRMFKFHYSINNFWKGIAQCFRMIFVEIWYFLSHNPIKTIGPRYDDETFVVMMFPPTEENHNTLKDLGYVITDNDDIEFELIVPREFNDNRPTLVELILDYEMWLKILDTPDMYAGDPMEVPKRKLSEILCEFFLPIVDGRV